MYRTCSTALFTVVFRVNLHRVFYAKEMGRNGAGRQLRTSLPWQLHIPVGVATVRLTVMVNTGVRAALWELVYSRFEAYPLVEPLKSVCLPCALVIKYRKSPEGNSQRQTC